MNKTVKIKYDPEEKKAVITYEGRSFDTSRIDGKPIEEWAYPFIIKQVRWNGLFDELCSFLGGEKNYVVLFEGADADLEVLKGALSETTAKLAGTNNKVSIMYNNTQLTTKISVNGKMLDTSKIQNRSIDEWINPIQFRDIKWEGIFKEIENEVNTDIYTIRFMGKQEDMKVLMDACPQNVDIVYGAARAGRSGGAASSKASGTGNGISAGNMIGNIKGAVGSVNAGSVKDIAGKMTQEVSDEEINKNLENMPIK